MISAGILSAGFSLLRNSGKGGNFMGKKAKEGSVNLYYLKNQNEKNNKSVSKSNSKKANISKKKTNKNINKNKPKPSENKFNFDDEFVIGVTKIEKTKSKLEPKTKSTSKGKTKANSIKTKKVQPKKKSTQKQNIKIKERKTIKAKLFKYVFLTCALLAAIICFMLSPVFNIKGIEVNGNSYILAEQIISLSGIKIGENIYKTNKKGVINNIKQNSYIENVEVKRKFPAIFEINVKERQATYMLEYVNSYVYINNQGYMLEISDQKLDKPIITGISTIAEDIKPGNRLAKEDLLKLEDVLKIMESATSNEIERLITKIDITDKLNYILHMETEGKTVRLGDISDISTKMLHVKAILERNQGLEGEIAVDSISKDNKSRFIQKVN